MWSTGLPRVPQEAPESSQEPPEELKDLQKKISQKQLMLEPMLDQFWANLETILVPILVQEPNPKN